ncbi:hypothetical protein Tco_0366073 [Tanacetum coccineum]
MPYNSPLLGGHTPESDKGSKKLNDLKDLCTKLSDKVTSLEEDLKKTKKLYGKAITKLVKKVKHLEYKLKSTTERRKARLQFTPIKVSQGEEQGQGVLKLNSVLRAKVPLQMHPEKSKEQITTDEKVAQNLNDEEMARAAAREEQERTDFEKAL